MSLLKFNLCFYSLLLSAVILLAGCTNQEDTLPSESPQASEALAESTQDYSARAADFKVQELLDEKAYEALMHDPLNVVDEKALNPIDVLEPPVDPDDEFPSF